MVRIVFHANKPMWVGLFVGLAGAVVLALHSTVLRGEDWMFPVGFGVAISGMIIYLAGRTMQFMKKRY